MKRCKYAQIESSWITSEEYDIINKKVCSSLGYWAKPYPGPICIKFMSIEEQFKKFRGFFYCDEEKCDKCEFYDPEKNGKEVIKNNIRNPIDSKLRHEVFKRDKYKCLECGASNKEKTLHVDHIIPVSQGGSDEIKNLQTLCEDCNLAKSNKCWKGGLNGIK